jgi:hypothetical protein
MRPAATRIAEIRRYVEIRRARLGAPPMENRADFDHRT